MSGKRAAQRESTATALVSEARRQFASRGYAAVRLAEIVSALGITKGALYHHFNGKAALFRRVVQDIQQEVGERVSIAAAVHKDPWSELVAGCDAFLAAHADPEVQQIMLVDAPSVLGWHEWRAMDDASSGRLLTEVLAVLAEEKIISAQSVTPIARLLSGAMNEAAIWLAETDSPTALDDALVHLHRMLDSLRAQ